MKSLIVFISVLLIHFGAFAQQCGKMMASSGNNNSTLVLFINGINNEFSDSCKSSQALIDLGGGQSYDSDFVYNFTDGGYFGTKDLGAALSDKDELNAEAGYSADAANKVGKRASQFSVNDKRNYYLALGDIYTSASIYNDGRPAQRKVIGDARVFADILRKEAEHYNNIIVVAHSQGNFYIEAAYAILTASVADRKTVSKIQVVGIAPVSSTTPNSNYILNHEDRAVFFQDISTVGYDLLPYTVDTHGPQTDFFGHSFDNFYLSGEILTPSGYGSSISMRRLAYNTLDLVLGEASARNGRIQGISPSTAVIGENIFTVTGVGLTAGMLEFNLDGCGASNTGVELPGGTSTQRQFKCTITTPGTKQGYITDKSNLSFLYGKFLGEFSVDVGAGSSWSQIAAGANDVCAIDSGGKAYCWGGNYYGVFGNGSYTPSATPVAVSTDGALAGKTIKQIAISISHACAIASDDQAYCWGDNTYGKLGTANVYASDNIIPAAVSTTGALAGKTIKQISVGNQHTCAIASDNLAYCWGNNDNGQLGDGSTTNRNVPVPVTVSDLAGKTIKQISVGYAYTCAIASDDQAYCWGSFGPYLGHDFGTAAVNTDGVLAGKTILQISAGYVDTCAIASDNKAYCWGHNFHGELGNNSPVGTSSAVPVAVVGALVDKTIKQIVTDQWYACAIDTSGQVYCWGYNSDGQLGDGSTTDRIVPVAVSTASALTGKTIKQIAIGSRHTCAIDSDGQAYCWGGGYGPVPGSNVPVAVANPPHSP